MPRTLKDQYSQVAALPFRINNGKVEVLLVTSRETKRWLIPKGWPMKGKKPPVVAWSPELLVVDPSPIVATVDRLERKGGREVIARCPSQEDAEQASEWLLDRLSRYAPDLAVSTQITSGGGQYMLFIQAD